MHIGLIGGIGPAATQFYYRHLVAASKAAGLPYRMTITHADNAALVENFFADKRHEQAAAFNTHIGNLKGAGCDVAAITALAGHFCVNETSALSPLPIVNAVDVIRDAMAARGITRLGLLGAGRVMKTGLWGAFEGIENLLPQDADAVGDAYISMAQRGNCDKTERAFFFAEGARLIDAGAEAVFLAGTDLFLAFEGHDPGYTVIDGGQLHIAELARFAEKAA